MTPRPRTLRRRAPVAATALGCLLVLSPIASPPAGADAVSDARAEARRVAGRLDAMGRKVSILAEDVDEARLRSGELAGAVQAAERELARAEAEAAGARSQLAGEAITAYVGGGLQLGGALPQSDGDALRRSEYALSIQARRADTLDLARAQAAIVRDKRERLAEARSAASAAVRRAEEAQRSAEAAAVQLEAEQGQVQGELAAAVAELEDQRAAAEAAETIRRLNARRSIPVAAPAARPVAGGRPAAPATRPTPTITTPPTTARPAPGPTATTTRSSPTTTRPTTTTTQPDRDAPPPSSGAQAAIAEARRQIGKPYRWGGSGPDSFDCSGLTAWAWRAGGRSLPHSSRAQHSALPKVDPSEARPGDLFFYGDPIHHVSLFIGGNQTIEASRSGVPVKYGTAYRRDLVGVARP